MKRRIKPNIFCLFLLIIIFPLNAYCEKKSYVVVFEEGYYKNEGRYRAKITVYHNNYKFKTKNEIRGSTLPNRFLYHTDKDRPIITSGEYRFDVKFSRKFRKALCLNGGGYIETINLNPHSQNKYLANGIWVHKGRGKSPVKGSEGCLTIAPDNWNEFMQLFPRAEDWKKKGYKGKIIITRGYAANPRRPSHPSNFRIH